MEKISIKNICALSENGIITTKQISDAGLHRGILNNLVKNGDLSQWARGLYVFNNSLEDDFFLLQSRYKRGVYSHETALYLWGYSDRTPAHYDMTFPKGYNSQSTKKENIVIRRVIEKNYLTGIVDLVSPYGNIIHAYDIEKTLCDILRGNCGDIQIIIPAIKHYLLSKEKNLHKLIQYSEQLHVKNKILRYLEVLL